LADELSRFNKDFVEPHAVNERAALPSSVIAVTAASRKLLDEAQQPDFRAHRNHDRESPAIHCEDIREDALIS
jgi:hypothetical protein